MFAQKRICCGPFSFVLNPGRSKSRLSSRPVCLSLRGPSHCPHLSSLGPYHPHTLGRPQTGGPPVPLLLFPVSPPCIAFHISSYLLPFPFQSNFYRHLHFRIRHKSHGKRFHPGAVLLPQGRVELARLHSNNVSVSNFQKKEGRKEGRRLVRYRIPFFGRKCIQRSGRRPTAENHPPTELTLSPPSLSAVT